MISLDVENKASVISPTHESKMIARLQHCSGALQAVSSVADNKSSRSKIGRLSATRDGYSLLVCLPSASTIGRNPDQSHGS